MQLKKIVKEITPLLQQCSPDRYDHIQRVVGTCVALAPKFQVDKTEAKLVGLAHDMLREWSNEKFLKLVATVGYEPNKMEQKKPMLLHGRCAAILLKRDFGVKKKSILRALECHTLGSSKMDMLGILLYVSDYIEPGRRYITKRFHQRVIGLSPWEMVLAVNKHARKRGKRRNPYTRQLDKYAREMLKRAVVLAERNQK